MITNAAYALLVSGVFLFVAGLVLANRAVLNMADVLNTRLHQRWFRWYNALGAGSTRVIREYGAGPERRLLHSGYVFCALGFGIMCLSALIRELMK